MIVECEPYIDSECIDLAKGIISGLSLSEIQTKRVINSLQALTPYSEFAGGYAQAFRGAADGLGLRISSDPNSNYNELHTLIVNRLVTYDFPESKQIGITRGLSHGFYRSLTLPQIIESSIKADYCHEHCLLIESNFRALMFKGAVMGSETIRLGRVLISGMADKVGVIRGSEYSNRFYRSLVKMWKPDVYFVNNGSGLEIIKEAENRAKMVGAELVILPDVSGRHTSDFVNIIKNKN